MWLATGAPARSAKHGAWPAVGHSPIDQAATKPSRIQGTRHKTSPMAEDEVRPLPAAPPAVALPINL